LARIFRTNDRGHEVLAAEGYEVERSCGVPGGAEAHPSQCANRSIFAWPEFSPLRRGDRFCRPFVACVPS
jgi:hypothetical protein